MIFMAEGRKDPYKDVEVCDFCGKQTTWFAVDLTIKEGMITGKIVRCIQCIKAKNLN